MTDHVRNSSHDDDAAAWVIPLHGIQVPPTADTSQPLPPQALPGADLPNESQLLFPVDEIPSDEGYHPRLRRSA